MKKNFIIFAALMVTAFFGAEIAKAADVSVGGQILTRYEVNEHGGNGTNDFTDDSAASDFIGQRTVVDVKANINDETSAFIQLQSNRQWGSGAVGANHNTATANRASTQGANDGSFQANDADISVGIHEAYFTLKNFASLPVDAKVGRQEVIIDGHRLFGDTLWTMGQQTHDGIRLTHKHDNVSFNAAYIRANESAVSTNANQLNNNDVNAYLAHMNYKGLLGGQLSVLYAYLQDPCGAGEGNDCTDVVSKNDIHTIGFRQAGQMFGIDYRGEYYYQWGDGDQDAQNFATRTSTTAGVGVDRDAYMFGVRVGKAFNNVNMKPGITVWYDYLSGTSDSDLNGGNPSYNSFNTLFDTGHKFYGLQDLFLGVGSGNSTNGTAGLGLQDLAVKAKLSPMPGWTVKADYHWFSTAEGVQGSPTAGMNINGDGSQDSSLGNELDITLVNKYNANTKIMIGFSNYTTTAAFRDLRGVTGDSANWAYLQFDVKF
jgi:hypothetical protein